MLLKRLHFIHQKACIMRLRFLLLCLLFIMGGFLQQVAAQQIAVSGKVTNKSTGEALAGASVVVQGTQNATQTNAQGQFTINVAKGAVVVVSFEGFESVKNTINGPTTLGIALELSTANTLNAVSYTHLDVYKRQAKADVFGRLKGNRK